MRISRFKIILGCTLIFSLIILSCKEKTNNKENIQRMHEMINKWTTTEVLNQKYTAERKYNDSINCISSDNSFNFQQKDSVLKEFSRHPEILKEIVSHCLENQN